MNERSEHLFNRAGRLHIHGELGVQKRGLSVVQRRQQLPAIGKVLVHERATDARPLGDRLHRDGLHVTGGHERRRGIEDGVAPFGPTEPRPLESLGLERFLSPRAGRSRRSAHGVSMSPIPSPSFRLLARASVEVSV